MTDILPTDEKVSAMGGCMLPRAERNKFCCLCGEPRRPTQKPVESFSNNLQIVIIKKYRELKPGRWEISPQLLVNVSMWRNGGTAPGETHICDGCIVVGLRTAKEFVDASLAALET